MVRALLLLFTGLMFNGCLFKDDIEEGPGCSNTCQYAKDGECDDGRPGSVTSLCPCGTDCSDCGTRSSSECGSSSGGSSSGGSSSSGSSGSSSSGGSSSGSSSGGSSSSSSSSSSSGGVTYMPTGTVKLVFVGNHTYSGSISLKTGQVQAPWSPSGSLIPYSMYSCAQYPGLGYSDLTYNNVVYLSYSVSRCGTSTVISYQNTFMPSYQGHTVTLYIGQ